MTTSPFLPGADRAAFAVELEQIVEADEPVRAMLEQIGQLTKRLLAAPVEASVTVIRDDEPATVAFTDPSALDLDETQYESGFGPCVDAAHGHQVVMIREMREETRWPEFAERALRHDVHSSLSIPLPLEGRVVAALNIYASEPDRFGPETVEVATTIAEYAAAAVTNTQRYLDKAELARQMSEAMASRAVIEQAKGILMATHRCNADDAFDALVRLSQQTHHKLRDIAALIVRDVTR